MKNKYKLTVKEEKDSIDFLVEYDKTEWKTLINKKEQETLKKVNIKGFRAGNVPLEIAKKEVNKEYLINQCADDISEGILAEIISSDDFLQYASKIYLTYPTRLPNNCTLDEFSIIFRFDKLSKLKEQFSYNTISLPLQMGQKIADDYADNYKQVLLSRKRKTKTIPDTQQPLANKQVAVFDFVGYVDGEEFEGGKASDYELEIGSGQFIQGFEEQMIGMKMGETKQIKVSFPKEYLMESLAGKEATFKITLHEIKEFIYPVFNDKFVEELKSENFKTVAEYEKWINNVKEVIKEQNDVRAVSQTIIDYVLEHTKLEDPIPANAIMWTFFLIKDQTVSEAANRFGLTFPQYLQALKITEEQFNQQAQEEAKRMLSLHNGLLYVFNKQNLSITNEDLDKNFDKMTKILGKTKEDIVKQYKNNVMFAFDIISTIIQNETTLYLEKINASNKRFDPTEKQQHKHNKDCDCKDH